MKTRLPCGRYAASVTTMQRWAAKVRLPEYWKDEACWGWAGTVDRWGYGTLWDNGRSVKATRFSYQRFIGPIPDGLVLDHLCRNPNCVNPSHLEAVTDKENVLRGVGPTAKNARKSHCLRGHELAGENLYLRRDGTRLCLPCQRTKAMERYWKNPEKYRAFQRTYALQRGHKIKEVSA